MTTLKYGDSGKDVKRLQRYLKAQGFFTAYIGGNFFSKTRDAVIYFQQTHLGPDGTFLATDGIVGENTWWALEHPSGEEQRSQLPGWIPSGLTPMRIQVLNTAIKQHNDGVHEIPDGSNWGDGVTKYGGQRGSPWCCLFWSWCGKHALGDYFFGAKYALVLSAYTKAKGLNMWLEKDASIPIPGDAFVMLYKNIKGKFTGRGHIGFVLRVQVKDGKAVKINTIEGNCGNRVKIGSRDLSDPAIAGFINPFPTHEQPTDWQTGLLKSDVVGTDTTR